MDQKAIRLVGLFDFLGPRRKLEDIVQRIDGVPNADMKAEETVAAARRIAESQHVNQRLDIQLATLNSTLEGLRQRRGKS